MVKGPENRPFASAGLGLAGHWPSKASFNQLGEERKILMRTATSQAFELRNTNCHQRLIEQAKAGDRRAFEELIFEYDHHILGLTLRVLGNRQESKEAYQEIFLKAFRSIGRFPEQGSFYTWIFRIAIDVCEHRLQQRKKLGEEVSIDRAPSEGRVPLREILRSDSYSIGPEQALSAVGLRERISKALNTLSTQERLVFELKHYQGLRLRQIVEVIGSTEDTIKLCLYRAVRKLRSEFTT
jgi:RNA polymerase sigma-70 factor, ECF subfamily